MKNENKTENYIVIISFIVIIILIGYVIFTTNNSSNTFTNNTQSTNQNNNVDIYKPPEKKETQKQEVTKETNIAYFSTIIYDKDEGRIFNLKKSSEILTNTIIPKGETFSFNQTIGPMGKDQGFKEAIGFDSNGNIIKMYGGGMCQISSTLYNAALIANLPIIERHQHSNRVYYVPINKDATIYYDSKDLKFQNNTENDIKITADTDGNTLNVNLFKIEKIIKETNT